MCLCAAVTRTPVHFHGEYREALWNRICLILMFYDYFHGIVSVRLGYRAGKELANEETKRFVSARVFETILTNAIS